VEPGGATRYLTSSVCAFELTGELIGVIDDDPAILASVSSLLRSVGCRVSTFRSAESFLGSSERWQVHCLVLDLELEGMGGLALLSHLGSPTRPPTVVLTALASEEARVRALGAGSSAFLTKPPVAGVLIAAIRRAIATEP
jgi:FixJ family two-component response regulator